MYAQSYIVSAIAIDESQARETENAVEKDYSKDDEELSDEYDDYEGEVEILKINSI